MQIKQHEIQIWACDLDISQVEQRELFHLLSEDERARAKRFLSTTHQIRFIAARASLRIILSFYLNLLPQEIIFSYDENHKPQLADSTQNRLQFNLSHSEDKAVFAFTPISSIGVDIEKIRDDYNAAVAERYFSPEENAALLQLPPEEKNLHFFRIWTRKEAILKALGKGLSFPLSQFSVSSEKINEIISLENQAWSLISLQLNSDYPAAVASNQVIKELSYWSIFDQSPQQVKKQVMG